MTAHRCSGVRRATVMMWAMLLRPATLAAALHPFHEGGFQIVHAGAGSAEMGATLAGLIYLAAGVLLMYIARSVRRDTQGALFALVGLDRLTDPRSMAEWAGGRLTGLAMITLITAAALIVFPEMAGVLVAGFLLGTAVTAITLVRGTRRFLSAP